MPTTVEDQFYTFDPANPPPAGTQITWTTLTLTDANDDGDIDNFNNDTVNGSDVQNTWPGDTVTIDVPGVGEVTYTGTTFYLANGQRVFTPTDGQVLQNGTLVSTTFVTTEGALDLDDLAPPCFTLGTLIETPAGEVPVETLRAGDLVTTLDNGPQPVRWIGHRRVQGRGRFAPVRFAQGAVGNRRPLLVSPQHRMLVRGWRAELLFGEPELLVAALHLVDGDRVTRQPQREVDYVHLMFDRHEIVVSEGAPTESFNPGATVLRDDDAMRRELLSLFPEMDVRRPATFRCMARPTLRGREARSLLH